MPPLSSEEHHESMAKDTLEELLYFAQHLTFKDRDERSIILIGHLLVEEQLVVYVKKKLKRPEKIEQFTFSQYLKLAEALNDTEALDWIFLSAHKLNKLRNKSSHILAPPDLKGMMENFSQYVAANSGMNLDPNLLKCNLSDFRLALLSLYAALRNLNRAYFPKLQIPSLLTSI